MTGRGPRGWQPVAFVEHVRDVLGELNRRHDRRLVLRAFLDLPPDWTSADTEVTPRVAWRPPHGLPAEALGVAKDCPLTELRWQDDAPHPDDLTQLRTWLAQQPLLMDALLVCGAPELRNGGVVVPLQLWVPRLWLVTQPDGRAEASLVLLGEDDPDAVMVELRHLLALLQTTRHATDSLHVAPVDDARHTHVIDELVTLMRAGQAQKVVWSRVQALPGRWLRSTLAERMRASRPDAWVVDVQLASGQNLLCATPELLVACRAGQLIATALAGTGSLAQLNADDPRLDDEHGRVRDFVCERLTALGVDGLEAHADIGQAGPLAHRRTQITGRRTASLDALTVALTLHPTPALLGLPRAQALALLETTEPPRALYGGCVGRLACDGSGDGEVVVLLRGVTQTGSQWHARAGAGLVPSSVAGDEAAEVTQKIAAIVQSLAVGTP